MDTAVGLSGRGAGGSRRGSQQAVRFSAGVTKFPILGLPGDFYFVPSWLCYL